MLLASWFHVTTAQQVVGSQQYPCSQRRAAAASSGAQTTKDCKGHSRQMITLAFLEEGGYFDVPIQVKVFLEWTPATPL